MSDDNSTAETPPLAGVLEEHSDEASFLWLQRADALDAPNYSPQQFFDLDQRLEAHLDGLRVGGDAGWTIAEAALDNEGAEDFFAPAVLALEASQGGSPSGRAGEQVPTWRLRDLGARLGRAEIPGRTRQGAARRRVAVPADARRRGVRAARPGSRTGAGFDA